MKILLGMACLLLTVCTPRATAVAIRPVTVVDVINGSLRGNQTVLVAGNRITAVGAADQVRIPDDADVLLVATDVGVPFQVPGISLHVELERLVEAGLSALKALQAATHNPARVLRMADSLGSIEPGKLADLVLLDANPLENIRNTQKIRAVVADGRLYRRADLDRLLAEVELLNQKVEKQEQE